MNTVVGRRTINGRRRPRRQARRTQRNQPVVVVQAPRSTRRRNRRRRGGSNRSRGVVPARGAGSGETFVFSQDNLAGSSSGSITFGPSLSVCPAFSDGILKAYHEYKITLVILEFVSEASSQSSGSIAYELDPHCKLNSLSSTINKFGITKPGRRAFTASFINGVDWHDVAKDQFRILYKGNGSSSIAGSFRITIKCQFHNPK
ncbi:coat protein [Beet leaf yellowing virus]|nr:P3 coat protein [Beet western yellows virus]BBG75688.1 coat protein [Beet leaf yellowing virus]BAP16769.1 P3 coat protein [Beet western yellows virus]BAP16774.1 P3 coat protein [Beet western yellows virus]BAP16779.1 P3 coat protein [Beet western yellows virus]